MKFKESIIIEMPAKKVFKFLSNYRSHKQFSSTYREAKQVTEGKMEEGVELFTKSFFLGRKIETNSTVIRFVPEKEIKFKSTSGPVPLEVQFLLDEEGEATRVTLNYQIEPGGFFQLGETFLRPRIGQELEATMRNLKMILEAKAS